MAEKFNAPPSASHDFTAAEPKAKIDDEREGLMAPATGPATLKFVMQNLEATCQRARRRGVGHSEHADSPATTSAPALPASAAGSAASKLEAELAASTESFGVTELVPTDTWWAQRWIEKATPGEVAAMRELLL